MTPLDEEHPHPEPADEPPAPHASSWFSRLTAVVFIVFCFEIGLFLLIYPWTDAWTDNTLSLLGRGQYQIPLRQLWNDPYFRGTVSGFGILNFWIALSELFAMFRGPVETKANL